jgi:uncharacterized membrane protein
MMHALRRYLVAGLLVWVPLGVTVLTIKFMVDLMDESLVLLPAAMRPETLLGTKIPGLGVVLTLAILLLTGIIAANLFGRQLVRVWEGLLARIPLVRSIYSAVKQVLETVFSSTGQSFRKVVLVEYPRREMWTLAFVTGDAPHQVEAKTGRALINVYVPTTPNPTSGYFVMIPREDAVDVDISVDAGLKLILSTGVVMPQEKPLKNNNTGAKQPAL